MKTMSDSKITTSFVVGAYCRFGEIQINLHRNLPATAPCALFATRALQAEPC
jgi:hypothetical protein